MEVRCAQMFHSKSVYLCQFGSISRPVARCLWHFDRAQIPVGYSEGCGAIDNLQLRQSVGYSPMDPRPRTMLLQRLENETWPTYKSLRVLTNCDLIEIISPPSQRINSKSIRVRLLIAGSDAILSSG